MKTKHAAQTAAALVASPEKTCARISAREPLSGEHDFIFQSEDAIRVKE